MMNWDGFYGMGGWMGGWMWIFGILLVALLVLGIVAMVRALGPGASRDADAPRAIAARRLARGEITAEEYEKVRSTLAES